MKQNLLAIALLAIGVTIGYLARGAFGQAAPAAPAAVGSRAGKLAIQKYGGQYLVNMDLPTGKGPRILVDPGQDAKLSIASPHGKDMQLKVHAAADLEKDPFTIVWE